MAAVDVAIDARAEGALLLTALRAHTDRAAAQAVSRYPETEWSVVVRHAEWHDVMPLLAHRLAQSAAVLPADVAGRLRQAYLVSAARALRISRQLSDVLRALRGADTPVIPLKGAALAEPVYGNIALRPMRDLDLLVEPSRLEDVERVLLSLGYGPADRPPVAEERARWHHLTPFRRDGALNIEVHWTLEVPSSPFPIEPASLWRRAVPVTIAGEPTLGLSPEDQLLHLCLHAGYHHRFRVRLRHLADVSTLLETQGHALAWTDLAAQARAWGVERFVSCTLAVASRLLGPPLPDESLAILAPALADAPLVSAARAFVMAAPLRLPIAYREARRADGAREKAQVYFRSIFPAREKLRAMYDIPPGSWSLPLYYVVRPIDLARRLAGLMAHVGRERGRLPLSLERERNGVFIDRWIAAQEASAAPRPLVAREGQCH